MRANRLPSDIRNTFRNRVAITSSVPPPPLQAPGVPTFILTAGNAQILLDVTPSTSGGKAEQFAYQVRRRNAADTQWSSWQNRVIFTGTTATITVFNSSNAIVNGRRHRVRVEAINSAGDSAWSDPIDVTPTE